MPTSITARAWSAPASSTSWRAISRRSSIGWRAPVPRRRRSPPSHRFGSTFTVEGSLWGQLAGAEIVKPQPDEIAFIGQAYQRILDTQKADAGDAARLCRI